MSNVLLLRFDELADLIRPVDDVGNLDELVATGADFPGVVSAAVGYGRSFTSADEDGLAALDIDSGATLLTRDATIQTILSWDIAAAAIYGDPQTIYARGKGNGSTEYVGAGLELRVVNATLRIAEVRWIWQTIAGVLKTQIGGHFQVPPTGFLMITATRRWVSSTRVVLRYYLGDHLLAEVESVDGDIGGGTTGTTSIGTRFTSGAWGRFFDGTIDELRVADEEITAEEVAATYRRITVEQPRAYQLLRELHDPGFPIAQDRDSRAQRETRLWGHALGFAAAQAENLRENILPDRAYGPVLEQWERITKRSPKPGDDVDTRRRRVVGAIRQRRGISIPGVGDALGQLLDTDPANLDVIAFDQTTTDAFATLNAPRWRYDPSANWTIVSSHLRLLNAVSHLDWCDWCHARMGVGGNGRAVEMIVKLTPTTIATNGEAGIAFADRGRGNAITFGFRRDAGAVLRLSTEVILNGTRQGATNRNSPVGLAAVWLRLRADPDYDGLTDDETRFDILWSFTSADGPWTAVEGIVVPFRGFHWAGFYGRTLVDAAVAIDVAYDDVKIRAPYGDRPFRFYVLRDPTLPGAPDFLGANAVLRGLKQAHTIGAVVSTTVAKYDSDDTTYDGPPMGGL